MNSSKDADTTRVLVASNSPWDHANNLGYMLAYKTDGSGVEVTGSAPNDHRNLAVGFEHLTIYQAKAMELGLSIFEYLETKKFPSHKNVEKELNAVMPK